MLTLVSQDSRDTQEIASSLDELARRGALQTIESALAEEVSAYLSKFKDERDEAGRKLVVRNGRGRSRRVTTGAGTFEISAPRVNDRRPDKKFESTVLPPYLRRSANVESLLPLLYLKGLSSNNFKDALVGLLGDGVSGLSASSISNLKKQWESEFSAWQKQPIKDEIVYVWADGVNVKVRLGEDKKNCLLVVLGATADGRKGLLAVEPGYRESNESWDFVLRSLKDRGMNQPLLAIADGALGFWASIRDVYPETQKMRCWVHKIANVLDKLPKKLQPKAKELLHEIMNAETEANARDGLKTFTTSFEAKFDKATKCLEKDFDEMLTHFHFPAHHWKHIRTSNPIESIFSTVKLRTKSCKGAGNKTMAAVMAYNLMREAEKTWRRLSSPQDFKLLSEGASYKDGIVITIEPHLEAAAG